MEPGFLAEQMEAEEGLQVAWHPGEPRRAGTSFLGIDTKASNLVRIDPERLEAVTIYRCLSCGFLEAYAH